MIDSHWLSPSRSVRWVESSISVNRTVAASPCCGINEAVTARPQFGQKDEAGGWHLAAKRACTNLFLLGATAQPGWRRINV